VSRYLGLFGDHIVPAILFRYTQELRRPDLLNSKGKPLITKARLETVWTRLADRLATVVADTSMVTITPEYAGHFYDLYIHGKENAKLTGDRMKLLMLTLPFMARDLIAPEVYIQRLSRVYTIFITNLYHIQVTLINAAIDRAKPGSRLYGLPHVTDPSDDVVEVLIECMDWNIFSRRSKQTADGLADLHGCAVRLLDLLKRKLPDKSGEKSGWNFEKAHSILHKVREIVMWGNSDNTSCQSPEHAHIDLIKAVASCTNNKDVFMCILRFHARRGYLQHYRTLLLELEGDGGADTDSENSSEAGSGSSDSYARDSSLLKDRNFNVACEAGIRYPAYETMCKREQQFIRISVLL